MEQIKNLRGVKDVIGEDAEKFNYILDIVKNIANNFSFQTCYFPIIEEGYIYRRTLGEESDIVTKEMYNFIDKGNNNITLRPEFTAGIVRSLISNNLTHQLPLKFFSYGPLFRYERPQHGRQRQFYQINFEYFGNESYYAELEIILLINQITNKLNITNKLELELNSLGSKKTRADYQGALIEYLQKYQQDLSLDSQKRLSKNPLRILDSKDKKDQEILLEAPKISKYYQIEDQASLDNLLALLADYNISYKINDKLVRGLDYYNNLVFEFTTKQLGSQNAVFAGGRYDDLVTNMGGKTSVPAIGFAAGLERLQGLLLDDYKRQASQIVVVNIGERSKKYAFDLMQKLRANNIKVEAILTHHNLSKKLKKATKYNPEKVIIIGDDEVSNGEVKIKNFNDGTSKFIKVQDIYKEIK
jgi:histidyl-tRNA synthetase